MATIWTNNVNNGVNNVSLMQEKWEFFQTIYFVQLVTWEIETYVLGFYLIGVCKHRTETVLCIRIKWTMYSCLLSQKIFTFSIKESGILCLQQISQNWGRYANKTYFHSFSLICRNRSLAFCSVLLIYIYIVEALSVRLELHSAYVTAA